MAIFVHNKRLSRVLYNICIYKNTSSPVVLVFFEQVSSVHSFECVTLLKLSHKDATLLWNDGYKTFTQFHVDQQLRCCVFHHSWGDGDWLHCEAVIVLIKLLAAVLAVIAVARMLERYMRWPWIVYPTLRLRGENGTFELLLLFLCVCCM